MANNAAKSATATEKSADTATQAAKRAETAQASAETSATQADTARQGAETARQQAVTAQNTAKTCADSTAADKQAVQTLAEQVTADKANVAENAAKVAEDRKTAETAAQTAQAVADSLPEDYVTAVSKIAENTAEIGRIKLTDKELTRRVNALYDIGQGVTHKFETDTDTAYAKTVPTGAKLMSVKSIGGHSEVIDGEIVSAETESVVEQGKNLLNADDYYVSYKQSDGSYVNNFMGFASINIPVGKYIGKTLVATLKATVPPELTSFFWVARIDGARIESSYAKGERVLANTTGIAKLTFTPKTKNDTLAMSYGTGRGDVIVRDIQVELGDTPTAYAPYHSNVYPIPESVRNLPGYGIEGNVTDYEAKTYTQNNAIDGTKIKALDTPIITDISTLIDDDFLRNLTVEAGGSITFKNSNDSYRIPVPSEEEYIVKLSEVGGTT